MRIKFMILSLASIFIIAFTNGDTESPANLVSAEVNEKTVADSSLQAEETAQREEGEIFNFEQAGLASYYGPGFHGRLTANGETFDQYAMTAAHKKLPFGTRLKVTNEETGKSIIVRVNDRGPYIHNRIIDLSVKAAEELGIKDAGVAKVKIEGLIEGGQADKFANKNLKLSNEKG